MYLMTDLSKSLAQCYQYPGHKILEAAESRVSIPGQPNHKRSRPHLFPLTIKVSPNRQIYAESAFDMEGDGISSLDDIEKGDSRIFNLKKWSAEDAERCQAGEISSRESPNILDPYSIASVLPQKTGNRIYRNLRWIIFSCYRRLFFVIMMTNVGVLIFVLSWKHRLTYRTTLDAVAANLMVSIILRHDHVLNALFFVFSSLPHWVALRMRTLAAKFYTFGGVHSGCGVAATLWYFAYTILIAQHLFIKPYVESIAAILTFFIILLFVAILGFAHPSIRSRIHNWFETMHRYAGWIVTILLWVQTGLICRASAIKSNRPLAEVFLSSFSFWALVIITICIIYPWLRLRRIRIQAERLSSHALRLYFPDGLPKSCQSLRISDNPLRETHAFVTLPNINGSKGFSMIISAAGDWTNRIIRNPPSHLWCKGTPFFGVMRLALLFKSVLLVATGSGIAPCLSLLCHRPKISCRILWSTPSPIDTYGESIVDMVLDGDPNAMIVDTRKVGRPDLVSLAWNSYNASGTEAVFVVSNAKVTRKVIYGLETRGVPAFAPIFDS